MSHDVAFQCAIGGLAYANPTRQIYKLLASREILISALDAKLENKNSRKRILEWICLAYLWGDEALSSRSMQKIFSGGHKDLEIAAQFFWQIHSNNLSKVQRNLITDFWEKAVEWSKQQSESYKTLNSKLARLIHNFDALGEREFRLLIQVVADAHVDYGGDEMIEELDRLSETNPSYTVALLEKMFEKNTPQYDFNEKLSHLLRKLHNMGYRDQIMLLIDRLRLTLPSMFELYKQLRTASNFGRVVELKN